ncbi:MULTISPECIES: acetyl-CoA C-acetyltransferase [Streptomyces]|uniref:Acetyl-CoA C-acetyltransferase n=2 Tax=Streptomyces TaxID=1883 RepID=A0A5P2BF42_STRVZ|nr:MULTISPECIES: acetyl-CoA C-acetyltransferase [Streptomyces]MYY82874.1 acetyl-CoA C-acetyltransferase [Streptomyces sp. SID335]MYZ16634.1 acetyl-CoA C-acetyltransferase [Streptomyces sp. SID337]NEB46807.1 acetyl-CoA C-acetyltransferase [Streptomyces sp. SID339]QES28707.1 acetyl-CoA C-acetyltransferase [Streptomyces venezuelae]
MSLPSVRRVAVLGGTRIPFARSDGPYATSSNQDMLTAVVDGLVERYGLQGEGAVGEFVAGAVLKHSRDFNLAREVVLGSALDSRTPAYDLQQACGTGLQAVVAVANKVMLGQVESGIAGGSDTASDAPLGVNDELRRVLLAARRATSLGGRLRALGGVRPRHLVPDIPRNAEPRTGLSMGEHAAVTARKRGITRAAQDELAAASHQRLAAAYERGFMDDLVVPYAGLTRDQNLRPGSTVERLGRLKPVFGVAGGGATMTAGNSTPLTDGAAVVLLGSDEWAAGRGLEPMAHLVACETAAVDFVHGDVAGGEDGLLMAPAYAVPRMLERAGLGLDDFDFVEVHEAFASQVLATLAAWEKRGLGTVDRERLNVAGSSLATGHPFAATGARIVATLAKLLAERGRPGRGLISICAAGGQGVTAILERQEA